VRPGADAGARDASAVTSDATEVYVGAVGGIPVRATLMVTPTRVEGRWVYETRGAPDALRLESVGEGRREGSYALRERTDAGLTTGELFLDRRGPSLEGRWRKPGGDQEGHELRS
jgi:hypothetical protein